MRLFNTLKFFYLLRLREDNLNLKEQNEKLTEELKKIRQRAKKYGCIC